MLHHIKRIANAFIDWIDEETWPSEMVVSWNGRISAYKRPRRRIEQTEYKHPNWDDPLIRKILNGENAGKRVSGSSKSLR